MKIKLFIFVYSISVFLPHIAFAFDTNGHITAEIDYESMEIFPPEIECDEPVVKGDPNKHKCLPKIQTRIIYAFTEDQEFRATLLFYNIFDEILGESEIAETLRWEEDHLDVVDFIYIYPEHDFQALKNSHHIVWEVHKK